MLPIILAIRDENDRDFVESIYLKYGKQLVYEAKKKIHNEIDVEDCVQDVFVVLIDKLQEFQNMTVLHQRNFLRKCCRTIATNKYNRNKSRFERELLILDDADAFFDAVDDSQNVLNDIIERENLEKLIELIENMNPLYGDVLYFRYFLGYDLMQIAKILGISYDLVKMRVSRAKKLLEEAITGVKR